MILIHSRPTSAPRLASVVLVVVFAAVLSSCSLYRGSAMQEPEAAADATPPPNYNPVFLKGVADVTSATLKPLLSINRLSVDSSQRVSVQLQLNDVQGQFLRGATKSSSAKYWCEVYEIVGDEKRRIRDFTIREVTESDRIAQAIAVVIDNSGSMGETRARATQDAAAQLIRMKKSEDQMCIIRYDSRVGVEAPLDSDTAALLSMLKHDGLFGYGGGTAIANGINAGLNVLESVHPSLRRSIIVLTDGMDNSSTIDLDSVLRRARALNVGVHTIDFGNGVAQGYMAGIAQRSGGVYHQMYRTSDFANVFEDAYRKIKNYYTLSFKTNLYGEHRVTVKVCLAADTAIAEGSFSTTPNVGDLALLDVYFDSNKSDLKPESRPALDKVLKLMRSYPTISIEILGHTDANNNTKDPDYNTKLSQRRADAVMHELIRGGIASQRITAKGLGETQPVSDNTTAEGRALNRRTEFVIVAK